MYALYSRYRENVAVVQFSLVNYQQFGYVVELISIDCTSFTSTQETTMYSREYMGFTAVEQFRPNSAITNLTNSRLAQLFFPVFKSF